MLLDTALANIFELARTIPYERVDGFLKRIKAGQSVDASLLLEAIGEPELSIMLRLFSHPDFVTNRVLLATIIESAYTDYRGRPAEPFVVWTGPRLDPQLRYLHTGATIKRIVESARDRILIAGYHATTETLGRMGVWAARARGVSVLLMVDGGDLKVEEKQSFLAQQIALRTIVAGARDYAKFHAKAIIVDGDQALIGSANFTLLGHTANIEIGLLVGGAAAVDIEKVFHSYLQVAEYNGWIIRG